MKKLLHFKLFIGKSLPIYLLAWLSISVHVAVGAAIPLLIRFYLDHVIGKIPLETQVVLAGFQNYLLDFLSRRGLWFMLILLVSLTAVQGIFMFLRGKLNAIAGEKSASRMREKLYGHIMHQPFDFQSKTQTGDLIQRCTSDIETVLSFMNSHAIEAIAIIAQIVIVLFIMSNIDVWYTLVSILLIPVILVLTIRFFLSMMKVFLAADEAEGEMSSTLQESLTGVRVVKAFAAQNMEREKFDNKNSRHRDEVMKILKLMSGFWSSSDFLCMLQFTIVIIAGAWAASYGRISTGTLVAFSTYAGMLIWPVRGLGQMMGFMGQAFVALERIQEIFDYPVEEEESGRKDFEIRGEISFDQVTFAYPGQSPVLDKLSLKIPAGKTTAVLGSTGSGKSTLIHLLLRLYDYQEGTITVDGIDLRAINRRALREQIGFVMQEPFLFSRDLEENIRLGRYDSHPEEIFEAAQMASIHKTISGFENGYKTIVGERGVTLSGGQRQRVAIARTLLRKAPVLIFDDSLSAVDSETDAAIRKALKERRDTTTTIIISHRITTLAQADQIVVLDAGKIVQIGSHEELIREEGLYRQIWEIQSMTENEAD